MRTWVLLLVIALLPLRMWAADGMAVRMAAAQFEQTVTAAHHDAAEAMPADCPMAKAHAGKHSGEPAPNHDSHCLACHLCAAFAGAPQFSFDAVFERAGPHGAAFTSYMNAELEPDLRPPIA